MMVITGEFLQLEDEDSAAGKQTVLQIYINDLINSLAEEMLRSLQVNKNYQQKLLFVEEGKLKVRLLFLQIPAQNKFISRQQKSGLFPTSLSAPLHNTTQVFPLQPLVDISYAVETEGCVGPLALQPPSAAGGPVASVAIVTTLHRPPQAAVAVVAGVTFTDHPGDSSSDFKPRSEYFTAAPR